MKNNRDVEISAPAAYPSKRRMWRPSTKRSQKKVDKQFHQ
jgi:hypothetical protein